ncbi:hypothetical protein COLO4_17497 [Corchorus olitorius]|uniref:Peptidase C1A papain C-terminal domain-containing protein n=1 Tax=Corchorus olitorius TaxID=93759 RepID=A0A1R3JCF8_9ROSI|nr:hypothetical protein COLO4_17497 [Corchorus olitorius]
MSHTTTLHEADIIAEHEAWMSKYGRTYANEAEKNKRFKIFKENFEYIHNINNAGNRTYKLSINKYSDLTHDEFAAARTGYKVPANVHAPTSSPFNSYIAEVTDVIANAPTSLDWRELGAVTRVKDQGSCGSCWIFAAVAATEGITKIKTGVLLPLSEKQVLDCSGNQKGCNGGYLDEAFKYIIRNKGLTMECNYPYTARQGTCDPVKQAAVVAKISSYGLAARYNEQELLKAVLIQPILVGIEASGQDFRHYKSGVFSGNCGTKIDHAVTVVGYGTSQDGIDYWLVKNSWGEKWGEKGYIRMKRNVAASEGLCGIAIWPIYPIA